MSTTPDNSKAYVWQDGDAFRAPVGTALPAAPFVTPLVTGTSPGVTWDAFGGIQAGFERTPEQDVKKHRIFNYRNAAYAISRGPLENTTKFRAVDYSKASVLTVLNGGSIAEIGSTDHFEWNIGDGEEFAFFWALAAPSNASEDRIGFYTPKATLATPPPATFNGEELDGWDLEIVSLAPLKPISNFNPLVP
ncbi:major tail protein [Gordonia phage Meyran]|uniref:Major tail protein n=1 Tax=Gordonia phage Nyceirae TaxID=1887651 RepID=A0A1C9EHX3_9CAUD|nr:major tail protein [Gordonia phage Nyceirae]AON97381.1 major tail protein [Gordonia phage Nyceirae]QBI97705.1 major tail protein [Gordonia phage Dogfish]QWY82291.1 major tail protein [Gordonia phage Phishy]UVF60368.1 major tail protein [Gordonia phage Meyran]